MTFIGKNVILKIKYFHLSMGRHCLDCLVYDIIRYSFIHKIKWCVQFTYTIVRTMTMSME